MLLKKREKNIFESLNQAPFRETTKVDMRKKLCRTYASNSFSSVELKKSESIRDEFNYEAMLAKQLSIFNNSPFVLKTPQDTGSPVLKLTPAQLIHKLRIMPPLSQEDTLINKSKQTHGSKLKSNHPMEIKHKNLYGNELQKRCHQNRLDIARKRPSSKTFDQDFDLLISNDSKNTPGRQKRANSLLVDSVTRSHFEKVAFYQNGKIPFPLTASPLCYSIMKNRKNFRRFFKSLSNDLPLSSFNTGHLNELLYLKKSEKFEHDLNHLKTLAKLIWIEQKKSIAEDSMKDGDGSQLDSFEDSFKTRTFDSSSRQDSSLSGTEAGIPHQITIERYDTESATYFSSEAKKSYYKNSKE